MTHKKVKPQGSESVDSSWLLLIAVIGAIFILIGIVAAGSDDDQPIFDPPTLEGKALSVNMELFMVEEISLSPMAGELENAPTSPLPACTLVRTLTTLEDEFFHVNADTGTYWLHVTAVEIPGNTGWIPLEAVSLSQPECN